MDMGPYPLLAYMDPDGDPHPLPHPATPILLLAKNVTLHTQQNLANRKHRVAIVGGWDS